MTNPKPIAEVLAAAHWNARVQIEADNRGENLKLWGDLPKAKQAKEMMCTVELVRMIGLLGWEVFAKDEEVFTRRIEIKPKLTVVREAISPTSVGPPAMTVEQSKQAGYEGDMCSQCGAMMMVRNGSCLKCMSCGSTTGCS